MTFFTRAFYHHKLAIQDLPEHNARMQVGSCDGILNLAAQHVNRYVRAGKVQDLAEGTRFEFVQSLLAIHHAENLNQSDRDYLGPYHFMFSTVEVRNVAAYQGRRQKSPKLNHVCRAGFTM